MSEADKNFYPPIPNADLKNCHGYEVDRVVVTKRRTWGRMKGGGWVILKEPREISREVLDEALR